MAAACTASPAWSTADSVCGAGMALASFELQTVAVAHRAAQRLAAWTFDSVGRLDFSGPETSWNVSSTKSSGYVVYGDYWSEADR